MNQYDSGMQAPLATRGDAAGASHPCPVCGEALKPFRFHETVTDVCPKGCGVWFDSGEMKAVEESDNLANLDAAFVGECRRTVDTQGTDVKAELENFPARQCPVHHLAMDRYEWNAGSGVVIDKCSECQGIWLDAGELESYAKFVKEFYRHPPELTPAIREKLDRVRLQNEAEWSQSMNEAAKLAVPWDLWFLDDLRRGLIKSVLGVLG